MLLCTEWSIIGNVPFQQEGVGKKMWMWQGIASWERYDVESVWEEGRELRKQRRDCYSKGSKKDPKAKHGGRHSAVLSPLKRCVVWGVWYIIRELGRQMYSFIVWERGFEDGVGSEQRDIPCCMRDALWIISERKEWGQRREAYSMNGLYRRKVHCVNYLNRKQWTLTYILHYCMVNRGKCLERVS